MGEERGTEAIVKKVGEEREEKGAEGGEKEKEKGGEGGGESSNVPFPW